MNQEWLAKTYGYQGTHFGVDYHRMRDDLEYRMDYLRTNLLAAMVELGEAANEMPWKPWTAPHTRKKVYDENRTRFIGEMVDVLYFVANALTAVGCTDDELQTKYDLKGLVNRARQQDKNYDGKSVKCPVCDRALDEPGAPTPVRANERLYCSVLCVTRDGQ